MSLTEILKTVPLKEREIAEEFRKRMTIFDNPVEFVNNMYGSHPGIDGKDYFNQIFSYNNKVA